MIAHFIIISTQCAALVAFLILWYFWVKKRIDTPPSVDGDDKILFPFRYFSWMLMGLVLVSCLLQFHFVRVSAAVHEKLSAISKFYSHHEQSMRSLDELRNELARLRRDVDANSRGLRARAVVQNSFSRTSETVSDLAVANVDQLKTDALASLQVLRDAQKSNSFAREAKASYATEPVSSSSSEATPRRQPDGKVYSMSLNRVGRVVEDGLSVKKRPAPNSPVVEQLACGEEVKVTEKRLSNEDVWFRIVTPSGRAGWVDYRRVRLEGNS